MQVVSVKINSFRRLKDFYCDFKDGINVFTGKNGLGKTTIIDAIMWLLTDETLVNGKDMAGNKNSNNIKDELNVEIELDNGNILKRVYFDKWREDLDGNLIFEKVVNDFYINGAKFKKTDYFGFIYDKILHLDKNINIPKDLNLLRCLVDYNYFGNTDYKITRKFIENILKLDDDITIISQPKYTPIAQDMYYLNYDFTSYINAQNNQFKVSNEEQIKLESTLEQLNQKFEGNKKEEFNALLEELKKENTTSVDNILSNSNEEYVKLKEEINKLDEEIKSFNAKVEEFNNNKDNKVKELINKGNELNAKINKLKDDNNFIDRKVDSNNILLKNVETEMKKVEDRTFSEEFCPYCQKSLNKDKKQEFEEQKQKDLDALSVEFERISGEIDKLIHEQSSNTLEIEKLSQEKDDYAKEYYALIDKKFNSKKFDELFNQKSELEKQISEITAVEGEKKRVRLNELNQKLIHLNDYQTNVVGSIEVVENRLKELKVLKAKLERNIALAKEFKNEKILSIKNSASKIFPKLEIELLEENPNTGAVKPTLYLKLKGVEYKSINDGHRKLVGIMVIEDLKKALNLPDLPIIFDKFSDLDKNTIKEILDITKAQIITTQVSSKEKIEVNYYEV